MSRPARILVLLFATVGADSAHAQEFLVSSRFSDSVLRFASDGAPLGVFASGGGMADPDGIAFGPDGNLYVADGHSPTVRRYDGATGEFIDEFVRDDPGTAVDETGGLENPRGIVFGPDDNLYVCSGTADQILRYEGGTGVFIDVFAEDEGLGPVAIGFGADGNLYVTRALSDSDEVLLFDGRSGVLLRRLSSGGVSGPTGLAFDLDGDLYVASGATNQVIRYEAATGNSLGAFVSDVDLDRPLGLMFRPDRRRHLYLVGFGSESIRRYDGRSGELIDEPVPAGGGGLAGPHHLLFRPREADCEEVSKLKVRCSGGGTLRVTVKSKLPRGALLTLENNSMSQRLKTKKSGKAKARFRSQTGLHRVNLLECPAYRSLVDCG